MTTMSDGGSHINADRGQIEQVIMNLAVNARDAIASNGTLRLATENVEVDDSFVAAHPGAAGGPHVRITVSDTGSGMAPDVLAHLFEPFYTTKNRERAPGSVSPRSTPSSSRAMGTSGWRAGRAKARHS